MRYAICILMLFFCNPTIAADFQDKPGGTVISTKRGFKISINDCKKTWEVSSESDASYCAVNVHSPEAMDKKLVVIDADHFRFTCIVKEKFSTKQFPLEIIPHGLFGYLIQAQGKVGFSSIEQCLVDEIRVLPNQEVSVTFALLKD